MTIAIDELTDTRSIF